MHYNTSEMAADWAIWDLGDYKTTVPMSKECKRYDGEGHGTQCGVEPGHKWEIGTPYTFNVSIVASNASGTHFAGFVKNGRSGEVYKLGEIFTLAPTKSHNCSRLIVGSSPFQEIYSGGDFTNIVSVEGPVFRGVKDHPADVLPTGASNCYYHHSCYGKDGPANCRNESSTFCLPPNCSKVKTTFASGHTPVPSEYIPPWDRHPDVAPSVDCHFEHNTSLVGGQVPEHWGMAVMDVLWPTKTWPQHCCGYCLADPDCIAAQLNNGDQCTLHHKSARFGPIKPQPTKGFLVVTPKRASQAGSPAAPLAVPTYV